MEEYFVSEESQSEHEFFDDINEQRKYNNKLQSDCENYENTLKELDKEKKERDEYLQQIQNEIEQLQMDILYCDLKLEKAQNVYDELNDLSEEQSHLDAQDKKEEAEKLDTELAKYLTKYINRVFYQRKIEFEDKNEKKKTQYLGVCVKYYKADPTNEEYGQYSVQSYSYQVFGLSNDLTFQNLFDLAKTHWNIENAEDFVLTDQDHHDLSLLTKVPIIQYLAHEANGYALFILRPKNTVMKELLASQKAGVLLIPETEKQGKIKEEFKKIFATLRKAKPGITSYEQPQEEEEQQKTQKLDGGCLNFIALACIMILIILSLTKGIIQPDDQSMLNDFYATQQIQTYYGSLNAFYAVVPDLLYDLNDAKNPINLHYIPIGVKRIIMNKMAPTECNELKGCKYEDSFNSENLNTLPLSNTTEGSWKYYTKSESIEQLEIQGEHSFFDGSGFIADVPINKTRKEAKDFIETSLKMGSSGNYFSDDSRAYIFVSTFFEPNRQIILERSVIFELTAASIVEAVEKKSFFKPYSSEDSRDTFHYKIDLVLLVLSIIFYVTNVIYHVIKTKRLQEFLQLRNLLKYAIIALVIAYFVGFYKEPDVDLQEIINTNKFQTFNKFGQNRQNALNHLTLAFFLHCITMIRSFVFSETINIFINIFTISYKDFLAFLFFFCSIFLGFSYVWWITFSPYHERFRTLPNTIFEIFQFFATGNPLIVSILFSINDFWTIFLILTMCFIVFIQLDALMMSIIQENVRYLYLKMKPLPRKRLQLSEALTKITQKFVNLKNKAVTFCRRFQFKQRK